MSKPTHLDGGAIAILPATAQLKVKVITCTIPGNAASAYICV